MSYEILDKNEMYPGMKCFVKTYNGKHIPVVYVGICGKYDSYNVYKWAFKDGKTQESYSVFFYRKVIELYRSEYQESWGEWFPLSKYTTKSAAIRSANAYKTRPTRVIQQLDNDLC